MTRDEILTRTSDLFRWLSAGELKFKVDQVFPLADAAKAHEAMAGRRTTGEGGPDCLNSQKRHKIHKISL
jgi:NADPH2:quinone reductase